MGLRPLPPRQLAASGRDAAAPLLRVWGVKEQRAYCRVYWSIVDDPKFADVYDNDAALATWLRLLIVADQAWPASASLPVSAKRRTVELLARVGLVDLLPGWRYRIHGLDAERNRRADTARNAAAMRWHSERTATASDVRMPSRAKPSQAEQSQAEPMRADPADTYWTLTGKYPTDKVLAWIDDLTGQYGGDAVSRELAARHKDDPDARTLLGRVGDAMKREARQLDRAEREAEQRKVAENRRVNVPLLIARHNNGQHIDASDPGCPSCKGDAA